MSRRKPSPPPPKPPEDRWDSPEVIKQIEEHAKQDEQRYDAYKNELTGIGDWNRDKTYGGRSGGPIFDVRYITVNDAEDRWRGSDLGGRIVETIPDEMTREGWDLTIAPDEEEQEEEKASETSEEEPQEEGKEEGAYQDAFPPNGANGAGPPIMVAPEPKKTGVVPDFEDEYIEVIEDIAGKFDELSLDDALWTALCYERAYGGGAILVGADDGASDLAKPLDEERIKSINWLNAFHGGRDGEVIAWSYYTDPRSPKYGCPEVYLLQNIGTPLSNAPVPGQPVQPQARKQTIFWVHESRMLVFPGMSTSRRARVDQRGWGDSIFTRVDEVLSNYGQTWGGIANLMTDFSQGVLKIDGLAKMLAGGDKASRGMPLSNRARQLQLSRSISRMLLIDSTEEFSRDTASLGGIAEILQQFSLRLAAAADMPVTLLMGQSPAGLNATGASDIRFFYDRIAAKQKRRLMPQIKRITKLCMLAQDGPLKGKEPARWNITFNPLYQMTELETAQLRKMVAETDAIYIDKQVLSPEEVTASAFAGSEWSMERQVDMGGREEMALQEEKAKAEKQKIMSEAAQKGVQPAQLAMEHPENPVNVQAMMEAKAAEEEPEEKKDEAPPAPARMSMSEVAQSLVNFAIADVPVDVDAILLENGIRKADK